ncbi:MAG: zinc-binding alcohol dehydrogenase family protein [Caulobacteraceae bacterium]
MLQMRLAAAGRPLEPVRTAVAEPGPGQIRLKVCACGVCRTDLHICDGDLPLPGGRPRTPGHEVVGVIEALGGGVTGLEPGQRVGVPWLARTCGVCRYCRAGMENLCETPDFTGWTIDGGYAEHMIAFAEAALPIPEAYGDAEAAPLLCAGLIGYRSWRMAAEAAAGEVRTLGLYGFGAAAHLLAQLAIARGQTVFAFAKPGDDAAMAFARALGCAWARGSDEAPPEPLDAAIIFAPDGRLVPQALKAVRKGGAVVCGGIHMSDIPAFPYDLLWGERKLLSVANLQRRDGREYLPLAAAAGVRPHVTLFPLAEANAALDAVRQGALVGAAVLQP